MNIGSFAQPMSCGSLTVVLARKHNVSRAPFWPKDRRSCGVILDCSKSLAPMSTNLFLPAGLPRRCMPHADFRVRYGISHILSSEPTAIGKHPDLGRKKGRISSLSED